MKYSEKNLQKYFVSIIISSIILSSFFGFLTSFWLNNYYFGIKEKNISKEDLNQIEKKVVKINEESAVIDVVEKVSPAVVSIIVTKDLPVWERYYEQVPSDFFDRFFGLDRITPQYRQRGTEKKEIGGGSGFIVSNDGYVVTNKHVVEDLDANYTVMLSNEEKYEAKVLARDDFTDLAVLKIEIVEDGKLKEFDFVEFGDSSNLKVGQSVIAIGNALAEFRNTVSTGVISGLSRSILASGGVRSEQLSGLIQTDASINPGNSGGPLLNLAGQVIGINTAMAGGAENIGFAIPVNEIKNTVKSVKENGRIVRPWLGVRYIILNKEIAENNDLDIDYGALLVEGESLAEMAVVSQSPADKAGLKAGDVILEIDGVKIDSDNNLFDIVNKKNVGDEIELKVKRDNIEQNFVIKLEENKS